MTYILANTQQMDKEWARFIVPEKYKVLSTPNQIRGNKLGKDDLLYIITQDVELLQTILPAMVLCRVVSCSEWIVKYSSK